MLILADDANDIFPESEKNAYNSCRFVGSVNMDHKNLYELPPISPSGQGKSQSRMAAFIPGAEHSQASS